MSNLQSLKHKYSNGPIPQWELDALNTPKIEPQDEQKKRGRPRKEVTDDGIGNADRDQGA